MAKAAKAGRQEPQTLPDGDIRELKMRVLDASFSSALLRELSGADLAAPVRPDLIKELLDLIQPSPAREGECREMLDKRIAAVRKIHGSSLDAFSPSAMKVELSQFHRALKKANDLLSRLNPVARSLIFDTLVFDDSLENTHTPEYEDFSNDLASLVAETKTSFAEVRGRDGRPFRNSRLLAATSARSLIVKFSSFRPTLTKDGRFLQVASKLYEAATGEREADLTRYCRRCFRR